MLAAALEATEPADDGIHGFHAYPARMHPGTARRIVGALSRPGDVVLDPFCGSGTVLVEARIAGRVACGADVHPLAVRLATLKTANLPRSFAADLVRTASRVAGRAIARARESRGDRIPGFQAARSFWQPHVARDLLSLQAAIRETPSGPVRDALWLVLSSLAVKVSDRASDTDARVSEKRIAAGAATRLFADKARELARSLEAVSKVPAGTPPATVSARDARARSAVPDASVALVLTSPPYPGTYDYSDHHAMRVWLLGLDASTASAAEIGARRRGGRGWGEGIAAAMREIARVLVRGGHVVLEVGDGIEGDRPVDAAHAVRDAGTAAGLAWVATASQSRPTWSGPERRLLGPEKREAIVALVKP